MTSQTHPKIFDVILLMLALVILATTAGPAHAMADSGATPIEGSTIVMIGDSPVPHEIG